MAIARLGADSVRANPYPRPKALLRAIERACETPGAMPARIVAHLDRITNGGGGHA